MTITQKSMLKNFTKVFVLIAFLVLAPKTVLAQENFEEKTLEGEIIEILEETNTSQLISVSVERGFNSGDIIVIENGNEFISTNSFYKTGDKIIISAVKNIEGEYEYLIVDYQRYNELILLFLIFAIVVVFVGQVWGALSLLGMAFSFFIIFVFILPSILRGWDAVLVTIIGSTVIIPVTFSMSHGIKRKTLIASFSTIITLIITGILASIFVELAHLTGFASEEAGFLNLQSVEILNMKGILLAGMIIATLGVLDDITISQASIVTELRSANSKLSNYQIYQKAMNVGRDHIASLVNTLVLVYTGASLPLLLLFVNNPRPFLELMNYEPVADEIVRTLIGSIGLVLAVPITTFIATYYQVILRKVRGD